jgi:6-phospho-3-hexuloisomerase
LDVLSSLFPWGFSVHKKFILDQISAVLDSTDGAGACAARFIDHINRAGRLFVIGAGRSGLVSRFFAMRLMHMGYQVAIVGEIVTPAIKNGDLLIVVSGSGGTKTLIPLVETAKQHGAKIVLVTTRRESAIGSLADQVVQIGRDDVVHPSKAMPMGSRFELSALVYLESIVADIIHTKDVCEEKMRSVHANLE